MRQPTPSAPVLQPSADLKAVSAFAAALERGVVDPGSLAAPDSSAPLTEIAIAPLAIEPLNLNE
jgi:hypothetical protein